MTSASIGVIAVASLALAGCASSNFLAGLKPGGRSGRQDLPIRGAPQDAYAGNSATGSGQYGSGQYGPGSYGSGPYASGPYAQGQSGGRPSPQILTAELERGLKCEQAGQFSEARKAYEWVLQQAPENAYAHHRLATIADTEGRFQDAEWHYRTALQTTPHDSDLLCDLGHSYQLQGRDEESERALREALRYNSRHRVAMYNLGALYGRRGNFEVALDWFRNASGNEADAQAALAQQLAQRNPSQGGGWSPPGSPGNPFLANAGGMGAGGMGAGANSAGVYSAGANSLSAPAGGPGASNLSSTAAPGAAPGDRELAKANPRPRLSDRKDLNPATRKIAEEVERRREKQEQLRTEAQQRAAGQARQAGHVAPQAPGHPIGAPPPQNYDRLPPAQIAAIDRANMTPLQRENAALAALQSGSQDPARMQQQISAIDAEDMPGLTRANLPSRVEVPVRTRSAIAQQQGIVDWPGHAIPIPAEDPAPSLGVAPLSGVRQSPASRVDQQPGPAINPGAIHPGFAPQDDLGASQRQPSPVIQAGPGAVDSAATRKQWDDAQLTAAQIGFNAGSGQPFSMSNPQTPPAAGSNPPAYNPPPQTHAGRQYNSPPQFSNERYHDTQNHPANGQPSGMQPLGSQSTGGALPGLQPPGLQPPGLQPPGLQSTGMPSFGSQSAGSQPAGTAPTLLQSAPSESNQLPLWPGRNSAGPAANARAVVPSSQALIYGADTTFSNDGSAAGQSLLPGSQSEVQRTIPANRPIVQPPPFRP